MDKIRRLATTVAFASALGLALTGCGSKGAADDGPHADPAAIAWVDKVCTGVQAGSAKLANPPAFDQADPQKARDAMVGFLTSISSALDDMAGGIKGAGLPPVPNGQVTVDKATGTLTETKAKVDATRTRMQAAKISDKEGLQQVIAEANTSMGQLSDPEGPIKDLKANPELNLAFAESPTCKRVYGNAA
ncbi:hypothetical protein [Amycolatopsis sp. H20-H5]|uniref:hypothetical protein n=1 Tax=Amycolatopsis sp. H20-H5 TaxID=3046309 RepID=UPI002DB6859E|nr:hypothetical protein [Amycolatopsis sp. H20-H5]MEC3978412.1 hypothetical protein [Amycolatopsis sp. H20-H5]